MIRKARDDLRTPTNSGESRDARGPKATTIHGDSVTRTD